MSIRKFSVLTFAMILCCLLSLFGRMPVAALAQAQDDDTGDDIDNRDENGRIGEIERLIEGVLSFEIAQQKGNDISDWMAGTLCEGAGQSTDFLAIALRQLFGETDLSAYREALSDSLRREAPVSAMSKQRCALALLAMGDREHPFLQSVVDDTTGQQGIMSDIFSLHLLTNGAPSERYCAADLICALLARRLPEGGWALSGNYADVDVTAMTLQALAPYQYIREVRDATEEALAWLSERQLPGGDFASFGSPNAESTAQVILALSALGLDVEEDVRFIKEGHTSVDGLLQYRLEDGSFCHTTAAAVNSPSATTQALGALVALWRQEKGQSAFYVFDSSKIPVVEELSVDPVLPDSSDSPENARRPVTVSYKVWAVIGIASVAAAMCLWLFLSHKRRAKNYVFILLVACLAVGVVLLTDIRSADRYYGEPIQKQDTIGTVTIAIRCDTVVEKSDAAHIPADGVILPVTTVSLCRGETVYDILIQVARAYRIQVENKGTVTGVRDMAYISGIGYLYEMDFGDYSGWVYYVNGTSGSIGCGDYVLEDGDRIEWLYTCDLGNDLK